jgi:hypothetical protein
LSARVRLFIDALIESFTALPPWLLGPDGRVFIVDEARVLSEGLPDSSPHIDGRPVFDTVRPLAARESAGDG